jgi:putative transposase
MEEAWQAVDACFGRFCLTAGVEALQAMMATDVEDLCGRRHSRSPDRRGHRWGHTRGKIGYQGGKVDIVRPRVRGADGEEQLRNSRHCGQAIHLMAATEFTSTRPPNSAIVAR